MFGCVAAGGCLLPGGGAAGRGLEVSLTVAEPWPNPSHRYTHDVRRLRISVATLTELSVCDYRNRTARSASCRWL